MMRRLFGVAKQIRNWLIPPGVAAGTVRLLRVFAQQSLTESWIELKPPLPRLLKCFDIDRNRPKPATVSVYRVGSEVEEVEAVAALFLTTSTTPEKRFGVLITEGDCQEAGIILDHSERGTTGIRAVDSRHVNLKGTVEAFGRLMARIVGSMWEGEQRIRCYPAQQIAGQIAIFSKIPHQEVDTDAKTKCLEVLDKKKWHAFEDNPRAVVIRGSLDDNNGFPVIACRSY
jgi:hypothetical protein